MATILDYRTIAAAVEGYRSERAITRSTEALLRLVAEQYLGAEEEDIADAVIDGSGDRGIDAIYIDTETPDERPRVYLFQSKFYEKEEKFDRNLAAEALSKMKDAISSFILKSPKEVRGANALLLSKLQDIKSLSNPKFEIIFIANSNHPTSESIKDFQDFLDDKEQSGLKFFELKFLCLDEIVGIITPPTRRSIDTKMRLTGKYFDVTVGNVRMISGRLSCASLAQLRQLEGGDIFDKNVRGYLSRKNLINKEIFDTATDAVKAHQFFILNNGLTIVCNGISYLPVDESPELEIKDLQIVNGGQTTNAIFEAHQANLLSPSAYVMVRIVQTTDQLLLEQIAETTNSQTNVNARDLRSNDSIQRKLEKIFEQRGYYYEARKNKYRQTPSAKNRRIDMELLAQAYYACHLEKPADAKNKKRKLFGALYDEIFTEQTKPEDLLSAFLTLQKVRQVHKKYKDQYTFVKYAELHSIAMLHNLGALEKDDAQMFAMYENILDATKEVVEEEAKKLKDQYSHRALFISSTTIGRILEAFRDKNAN
jgi:hypothetical protein